MNFDAVKNSLIDAANRAGIEEYEIFFMEGSAISAETLKGEISSFTSETGGGICFRCIVDGHFGSAATELFTEQEMCELVERALENGKNIESDDKAIIYKGAKEYAKIKERESKLVGAAELKKASLELLDKTMKGSEYIVDSTQTYAVSGKTRTELINSHGLVLSNEVDYVCSGVQAVVEKDGESQYGLSSEASLCGAEVDKMPKKATDEALEKIGAKEIPSGKYDIIIDGKQMRTLLSAFSPVFSGRQANLGLSLLKDKEGERVATECVSIIDDPMYPDSPMQTAFDGEGVPTYTKSVIEKGVLKTLLYDLASADKVGKESTGNGQRGSYASPVGVQPYHFYIDKGECPEEEIFERLGDGIFITELKGLHAGANAVTGDFSIESFGFEIKNGKKGAAVKSFTVSGNFFELLKNIEALSNEVDFGLMLGFTVFGSPKAIIRNMSIAGT